MTSTDQTTEEERPKLENEERDLLAMSFSYLFGTLDQQAFDVNLEAGKDEASGLQDAIRNHLFLTKKERLKMLA